MPQLPQLLPLEEAAAQTGLDVATLRNLVEQGKVMAGTLPGGEIVVAVQEGKVVQVETNGNQNPKPRRKEDTPEYQAVAHLKGHPIWIREAARKYGVYSQTISGWVQRGLIRRLGKDGKKVLVDEADVAYCVAIYRRRGAKRGQRLFDKHGLPYKPKSPKRKPEIVAG